MGRIVVGVDGSKESHEALRWALEEAKLRGAELHVVHVYGPIGEESPYAASYAYAPDRGTAGRLTEEEARWREERQRTVHERAKRIVNDVVKAVGADHADLPVHQEVIAGARSAQALIDRSRNADLLVVGSRGRGGFKGLLLGSVSQQLVQHAPCPVVVIRPGTTAD